MKKYNVFIDGSCKGVKDKEIAVGGWAYIITDEQFNIIKEDYGKLREGDQNSTRAELEALYQALLKMKGFKGNAKFTIYCDCESVVENLNGLAERKSNRDMWDKIEPLCRKLAGNFRVYHINSHQKNTGDNKLIEFNHKVDKKAGVGANSLILAPVKN